MTEIQQFALDFFRHFGAQVDESRNNGVRVILTGDLAAHFGKAQLNLVFSADKASVYDDLVVYGSRTFDGIMTYVEKMGEFTRQVLPVRYPIEAPPGGGGPPSGGLPTSHLPVKLYRCSLADYQATQTVCPIVVFNFHLTYRSDDKVEELYTIALDAEGQPVEAFERISQDARPLPAEEAGVEPPAEAQYDLVDLATEARRRSLFHADVRCAELEQDILPRLHKTLSRLVTYYEQQIAEILDGRDPPQAEQRRQELREDLKRKIAEETENHRLRVTAKLFSHAVILSPIWRVTLQLDNTRTRLPVHIEHDLYTGRMRRPVCHSCGRDCTVVGLCDGGHVVCAECLSSCHKCGQDKCVACGIQPCTACAQTICQACATTCQACGGWACADHISRCSLCQDMVCDACQAACSACGARQCRVHLLSDHISHDLVCYKCAITCPACQQPSAHTGACSTCGQVFCQACLKTCYACGKLVCPGHGVRDDLSGDIACDDCAVTCPLCQKTTARVHTCSTCGTLACYHCMVSCKVCGEVVCQMHQVKCSVCGLAHCVKHIMACHVCGRFVCAEHSLACPDCDEIVCEKHMTRCTLCGQNYSARGINAQGLCVMCASVEKSPVVADMRTQPVSRDQRVEALLEGYTWRMALNRCFIVYLGQRTLGRALIVADVDGKVLEVRKVGMVDSLLGKRLTR